MKKYTKFIILVLGILIIVGIHQWHFYQPKDILSDIQNGDDIINAKSNEEIKLGIDNLNISTNFNDKRRTIEFLDFCYELNDIKSIQSKEFQEFANIVELSQYLQSKNIEDPKECIKSEYLELDGLKKECIFNEDDGLHNPYLALYSEGKISTERFNKSMQVLAGFYMPIYPVNSYSLLSIYDKNTGVFKDKSYCDNLVREKYNDFIRPKEGNIHTYSDQPGPPENNENDGIENTPSIDEQ